MIFSSPSFALFFAIVFLAYWGLGLGRLSARSRDRARVWLLITASFYFYASWNRLLAGLIFTTTTIDYFIALGMGRPPAGSDPGALTDGKPELPERAPATRKLLLVLSLVMNLGLLCYFKYANFFLASLMAAVGRPLSQPLLSVILPVGISFYTFEAINYTVDTYRGRIRAERSLSNFLLFITFFPHLIAGPIVRARDFLPQTRETKSWQWPRMELGLRVFLVGLLKKVAIADRMALYADPVFLHPNQFGTAAVWMAVIAYAIQIYCDFSGYSDMALGCADLLGYRLAENFAMPYASANVSEFWHRWHISLSTWLRDYLFIPLGGSRGGSRRTDRNLMITMGLGGLWHGANWTFVIWGLLHGALLVIHRHFRQWVTRLDRLNARLQSVPGTVLRTVSTLLLVCMGWVFFRARSLADAIELLRRMWRPVDGASAPLAAESLFVVTALVVCAHVLGTLRVWPDRLCRLPAPLVGALYALAMIAAMLFAPDSGQTFIYFQF